MSPQDIERAMSVEEQTAYAGLLEAHAQEQAKVDQLAQAQAATARQVAEAIAAGVPAVLIAARLGLTKQRIYQLRNQALAGAKA